MKVLAATLLSIHNGSTFVRHKLLQDATRCFLAVISKSAELLSCFWATPHTSFTIPQLYTYIYDYWGCLVVIM